MNKENTNQLIALLDLSVDEWDAIPESVQDKLFLFFKRHKVFPKPNPK